MAVLFDDASTEYLFYNVAPITSYTCTVAVWAYDDETALNDRCLVQMQDSGQSDRYIRLGVGDDMNNAATALPCAVSTSSSGLTANASLATSDNERTLNQWHHFLGTYTDGDRKAYLDGAVGADTNSTAGDPFSDSTFDSIAIASERDSTPGDEWSGGIMWPAVWNKILSADEIAMATAGIHPTLIAPDSLVFFAPLDNEQGYRDWISGVAPTVNGTPVYVDGPYVASRGGILVTNEVEPPMPITTNDFIYKFGTQDSVDDGSTSAVATDSYSVAADITTWTNTDDAPFASFVLSAAFATMPTVGSIDLFAQLKSIDGANSPAVPDSDYPFILIGTFPIDFGAGNGTTFYSTIENVALPVFKSSQGYDFYLRNRGTSQSISAGWTLKISPFTHGPA